MEGEEDLDDYNEEADDFYVVDSWSEKSSRPDFKYNSSLSSNIHSKEDRLLRRKPTEGEIDEFLEILKQSNSNCGTSGLEGSTSNSFDCGKRSGILIKIPGERCLDKLSVINQAAKKFPETVKRFEHSIVSYKPGETLTKTFFGETSNSDLSRSINNNQEINISSSDPLFNVSFDRNEDSRDGFSDLKGSLCTNVPSEPSTMESSSHHLRRGRSRSPYLSSSSRYPPGREDMKFHPREGSRNHSHADNLRNDRNVLQDRRYYEEIRRHRRSRSRSRERKHHRRRSYERRSSISPSPKRESGNQSNMEQRQLPPYYPTSGASMAPNSSPFMNPNPNMGLSAHGPVQYPINSVSSNSSYGRYPGYNVPANNVFNSNLTQPQMPQNYPQNQYPGPQNYPSYNPVMPGNPPNPVSCPPSWNQSSAGFNPNYPASNVPTDAVMYPHLKIGQSRVDSYKNNHRKSMDGSPPHRQNRSLKERIRSTSRSPDPKKHKRKPSKRYSRSPVRNSSRYDSKKPKVIIDPNRIPTPPPPPIVGSYQRDESKKSFEPKMKSKDGKSDIDPLSEFLNKEKVSLSCLLEAVMETSGQGKSQLSDPKVKKEIISNCESKIQHLYKRRMTGLGAFIPDPIKPSPLTAHVSPLVMVYSPLTYNCEEENNEWHCPDIIVPEVKMKNDLKVPLDTFSPSHLPLEGAEIHSKTNFENATTIPTLSNNQSMPLSNWNANNPEHLSQTMFPNSYESSQPNMYPSHQGPQGWNNAVPSQNPYAVQPIPGSANDFNSLGPPPYGPSSYPFPHRPPGPQFMSQHSYPPQPDMLNYPSRMDYSPMHQFPPQNLNHPGMFRPSQPDLNRNNYQYVSDETNKRKSKNRVNDNLILLSNNSSSHSGIAQKDKIGNFKDDKRDEIKTDGPKDKNLKKGWKSRKSSEYDHDQPITKEPKDKFYSKLNYAEMVDDAQLDSMPDYQLTNLKERIETCLAEGKPFPGYSQHRSRDKREGDRHKDRDRGRDRLRDNERPKRGSMEGERKWCNKSPLGSERKKGRSVEGDANHQHSRKSKEPSDKQDHGRENVIEVLSDEDHNKHKLSEENEVLMNPDDHLKPSEKTLLSMIFDSLGPEIRKIQEKSDLYKSVIDTLDKGDKAYKRIYSFRNQALMKSDKDNRMKMVVPRDNLKEIVILIHKSFHHVQSEELSRLLKNITYPYMLYIPKCVTKVMSECAMCIEEKKKNNEPLTDQKSERKPEKRNNRSMKDKDRDRGRDRRNSADRYKRVSKDRRSSSSSKGRRDPLRSGREKDRKDSSTSDGRPSGYEKATKVRNPGVSSISKSNKSTLDNQEEKSIPLVDDKSSELLHGLNDKALEFKPISDSVINVSVDRSIPDGVDQESLSGFDKQDYKSASTCCDVSQNDSEEKEHDPVIESSNLSKSDMESSDLVMKSETESNIVTKPETEPSIIVTNSKMEPSSTVLKPEIESSNTVTESKQESSTEVMKPKMESYDTVAKTEMESSDPSTIPEIETSKISKIPVIDSSNAATKSVMESSDTVNKTEMESTDMVSNTEMESTSTANRTEIKSTDQAADPKTNKESVNIISGSSDKLKADTVDKNQKPNERFSDKVTVVNNQSTSLGEESKENKFREEKTTSQDENVNDSDSKAVPKLDFKGRVRQVQLSSNSCKNVIKALESKEEAADPSYLIKGGMLCKKDTTGNTIEVKIVVPCDELEKIVSIVHTMSAVHTPPAKVVAFFSKHFTQVENLDLQVNEIVGNCSYCKLKFS